MERPEPYYLYIGRTWADFAGDVAVVIACVVAVVIVRVMT